MTSILVKNSYNLLLATHIRHTLAKEVATANWLKFIYLWLSRQFRRQRFRRSPRAVGHVFAVSSSDSPNTDPACSHCTRAASTVSITQSGAQINESARGKYGRDESSFLITVYAPFRNELPQRSARFRFRRVRGPRKDPIPPRSASQCGSTLHYA